MSTAWKPPGPGALDDTAWPETLVARAVLPEDTDDRMHGYAMVGDLARHHSFADVLYLSITGELPDPRASGIFHLALCGFSSLAVNEAPAHVGVLSRITGGSVASAIGAGAIALADQTRHKVESHAGLFEWLAAGTGPVPSEFCSADPYHALWIGTLRENLRGFEPEVTLVRDGMTRDAARIALLYAAGVRRPDQMQAAIASARMCGLVAEVLATGPNHLADYPVKLPPFHYTEDVR